MDYEPAHADAAVALLPDTGREVEGLVSLVRDACAQVQALEDALWALYVERRLAEAEGTQLDGLGEVLGQARPSGASDADYLTYLTARVALNRSQGTAEDILAILAALVPGSTRTLTEYPPAGFALRVTGLVLSGTTLTLALTYLREARNAGVRAILEFLGAADADSFVFDGGTGLGLGDNTTPATGGAFGGALT